jgi:hypothetical protein
MLKALIDKDVTWRKNYQAAVRAKQREVEDLKRQVKSEYDAELKDYQLQIDELEKKKNATKGTMETRLAKLGETHAGIIAIANETVEAQNKDPICTQRFPGRPNSLIIFSPPSTQLQSTIMPIYPRMNRRRISLRMKLKVFTMSTSSWCPVTMPRIGLALTRCTMSYVPRRAREI